MTVIARIIIIVTALFISSCNFDINFGTGEKGNGKVVTDNREITDGFTAVSASEGIIVYVTQADDFNIKVEADENIIDLIGTDIKNGKLRIHTIKNIGKSTKKVYVSLPNITDLNSSSGAHLQTENTIKTKDITIDGSSGAILDINVIANEIDIDVSSGANLKISGEADETLVDVSSGGNINAKKLETQNCNADATSGGNISINVSKSLVADASSGGNISYSGDPENIEKKKSVSGSVRKY